MPLESVLFLALVLASLAVFAAVLIYAESATRNLANDSASAEPVSVKPAPQPAVHSTASTHIHEKAA